MSELEQQLRDEVTEQKNDYEPGEELLTRIEAAGHRRLRRSDLTRRAATGFAAAAAVIAVVLGVTRLVAEDPDTIGVATEGSGETLADPSAPSRTSAVARDAEETVTADEPVLLAGVDLEPELWVDRELAIGRSLVMLDLTLPLRDRVPEAGRFELRQYGNEVGSADPAFGVTGSSSRSGSNVGDADRFFVLDGYEAVLLDSAGEVIDQVDLPRLTMGEVDTADELAGHDLQPQLRSHNNEVWVAFVAPRADGLSGEAATWSVRDGDEVLSQNDLVTDDNSAWVQLQVTERYEAGQLASLRATIDDEDGLELATAYFGVLLEGEEPTDGDLAQARDAVRSLQRQVVELDALDGLALDAALDDYGALARDLESSIRFIEDETVRLELWTAVPLVDRTPVTEYGVGPLRAGMTLAEAEDASGRDITVDGFGELGTACWYGRVPGQPDLLLQFEPPGAADPGFSGGVDDPADGIISRISLIDPGDRATADGVRVGDAEAEAYAAYDEDLRTTGHKYLPDGHYLFHEPDTAPEHGISYFTNGEIVEEIHVGLRHAIAYVEGCG